MLLHNNVRYKQHASPTKARVPIHVMSDMYNAGLRGMYMSSCLLGSQTAECSDKIYTHVTDNSYLVLKAVYSQ